MWLLLSPSITISICARLLVGTGRVTVTVRHRMQRADVRPVLTHQRSIAAADLGERGTRGGRQVRHGKHDEGRGHQMEGERPVGRARPPRRQLAHCYSTRCVWP